MCEGCNDRGLLRTPPTAERDYREGLMYCTCEIGDSLAKKDAVNQTKEVEG